jgi:RNA polymerase sigma-70 factor (ECF subfamily)
LESRFLFLVVEEEVKMEGTQADIPEQQIKLPSRDESARQFDDVLSRCLPSFQRTAFRKLGNAADAEDAVQDALLSAYKHLDQFKGGARMSTWLTTIVINCARMQLRGRGRYIRLSLDESFGDDQEHSISDQLADRSPSPEDESRTSELHERLTRLLKRLSPPLWRAFQLRYLDGLNTHEAALLLDVPEGTVKAQLARARARLRELMTCELDPQSRSAVTSSFSAGNGHR